MHALEVLNFYSKCKAPTKEEREIKALGLTKTEYYAMKALKKGDEKSWMWFVITNKKYAIE